MTTPENQTLGTSCACRLLSRSATAGKKPSIRPFANSKPDAHSGCSLLDLEANPSVLSQPTNVRNTEKTTVNGVLIKLFQV